MDAKNNMRFLVWLKYMDCVYKTNDVWNEKLAR